MKKYYYESVFGWLEINGREKIDDIKLSKKYHKTEVITEWKFLLDNQLNGNGNSVSFIKENVNLGEIEPIYDKYISLINGDNFREISNKLEYDISPIKLKKIVEENEAIFFVKKYEFSNLNIISKIDSAINKTLARIELSNNNFFKLKLPNWFEWDVIKRKCEKQLVYDVSDNHISYLYLNGRVDVFYSDDSLYVNHSKSFSSEDVTIDLNYKFSLNENYEDVMNYFSKTRFNDLMIKNEFKNNVYSSDVLQTMIRGIISQLISLKAAATITKRFLNMWKKIDGLSQFPSAKMINETPLENFVNNGISEKKSKLIIEIAKMVVEKRINIDNYNIMTSKEIFNELIDIKGIGPWTINLILIFSLKFDNLFLKRDLGVRQGLKVYLNLKDRPNEKLSVDIVKDIKKYNTYLCLALWELKRKSQ